MPLTISSQSIPEAIRLMSMLTRLVDDLRPFWDYIQAPLIISEIAQVFETEGRGTWPPLSKDYAAEKAETHPGKTILRRDDNYIQGLTSTKHPGNVYVRQPQFMEWGIDADVYRRWGHGDDYPRRHEEGDGVPQRQVIGILLADGRFERNLAELAEQYLDQYANR